MVFDMKVQSEASFLYDVKILISSHSHPLPGISGTDNMTETLRAGRGAICWIHMSLKSCFYCLSITLTFERKQSLGRRRGAKRKWSSLRKNGNDSVAPQDTARWEGSQGK